MKNWILILSVIAIIGVGLILMSQKEAEAQVFANVVILHCETVSGNIKVVSSSSFGAPLIQPNTSCAAALGDLLNRALKIQSSVSDTTGAFNYTLVR